jgi:tyrosine-protein kinase Etk/Wzc
MASLNQNRIIDTPNGDEIHLSDYLAVVAESWKLILATAATVLLLGTLYAFLATPVYRADAMIQVEDNADSTKDALGDLASIFDTKQTADAEIELIRSRLVVGQTVRTLHLDISARPRYFPMIGAMLARHAGADKPAAPLFGLSRFAWGGEKSTGWWRAATSNSSCWIPMVMSFFGAMLAREPMVKNQKVRSNCKWRDLRLGRARSSF